MITIDEIFRPILEATAALEAKPNHSVRGHHKFGPSKLGYLDKCPGFENTEGSVNEMALLGTACHEVCDEVVKRWLDAGRMQPIVSYFSEVFAEKKLDETERGFILFCLQKVAPWAERKNSVVHIEVPITVLVGDEILTQGFPDLFVQIGDAGILFDYKFGWVQVDAAEDNRQGLAYAIGLMQAHPTLKTLAVMFPQPRLGECTRFIFRRPEIARGIELISDIIQWASFAQIRGLAHPDVSRHLKVGNQCVYCKHAANGNCPAKLRSLQTNALAMRPALVPAAPGTFDLDNINTPEKAALARYYVDVVEDFLDGVKKKAQEFAEASPDRRISVRLPDGQDISYVMREKNVDRILGDTIPVTEALSDIVSSEEVMACTKLSLGKLETLVSTAIYENANSEADQAVNFFKRTNLPLVENKTMKKAEYDRQLKALHATFPDKITKTQATEMFESILQREGLLSQPDMKIPYLQRDKSYKVLPTTETVNNQIT